MSTNGGDTMSIKEFLSQSLGNWVSIKTCQVNDNLTVTTEPKIDKESFKDKIYLTMDVILERTNAPMKLRLSGQQVQNLAPIFGEDAAKWVGRRIKIAAKQEYPGLGKTGFIYIPI
jgi:hypothetical protein